MKANCLTLFLCLACLVASAQGRLRLQTGIKTGFPSSAARSGRLSHAFHTQSAGRPQRIQTYTGQPGNWIPYTTILCTYAPSGDYDSVQIAYAAGGTEGYRFHYDTPGHAVLILHNYGGPIDTLRIQYQYDGFGRIARMQKLYSSDTASATFRFHYDANGYVDSSIEVNAYGSSQYISRTIFRNSPAGIPTSYRLDHYVDSLHAYFPDLDYASLQITSGFRVLDPYYLNMAQDLLQQPEDIFILSAAGQLYSPVFDQALLPARINGSETGLTAANVVQVQRHGIWLNYDSTLRVRNAYGDLVKSREVAFDTAGQAYFSRTVLNTLTYTPGGDLAEEVIAEIVNNDPPEYSRNVFSYVSALQPDVASLGGLYPNPASQTITVTGATEGQPWQLTDARGAVREGRFNAPGTIDISLLPPGIYVLRTGPRQVRFAVE